MPAVGPRAEASDDTRMKTMKTLLDRPLEASCLAHGLRQAGAYNTLRWDGRDDDGRELASGVSVSVDCWGGCSGDSEDGAAQVNPDPFGEKWSLSLRESDFV